MLTTDLGDIHLSFAYILASFHHNRAKTMLNQAEGCKQSTRAGTHHDDLWLSFHILISGANELLVLWHFVDVNAHFQVHEDGALTGIDASFQYTDCLDGPCINSLVLADERLDVLFIGCLLGQNSYLVFLNHILFFKIHHRLHGLSRIFKLNFISANSVL